MMGRETFHEQLGKLTRYRSLFAPVVCDINGSP
jgi:hypothetical protein